MFQGRVVVPGAGTLTLVGTVANVSRSISPPKGNLTLVGGTVTLSNSNWVIINTSQTPGWVQIAA